MNELEYKFSGKNIETISIYYGLFLITWGILVMLISGTSSPTALIPSFIGLAVFAFSYLAVKLPSKKKLFMHIVVLLGVLIFLGGFRVLSNMEDLLGAKFWADVSQIMMILTGGFFTYLCVQSFIFVRKNR